MKHKDILRLIEDFKRFDKDDVLIKTFTDAECYTFARMLWYNVAGSTIIFDKVKKHYVLEYKGRYYDITGETNIESQGIKDDIGVSPGPEEIDRALKEIKT